MEPIHLAGRVAALELSFDALERALADKGREVCRLQGLADNYAERLARLEAMHHTHQDSVHAIQDGDDFLAVMEIER